MTHDEMRIASQEKAQARRQESLVEEEKSAVAVEKSRRAEAPRMRRADRDRRLTNYSTR